MTDQPRRAHILVNPAARGIERFDPHAALHRLSRHGIDAALTVPGSPEACASAARRAAAEGVDLLFVAGGDGTLRLAAGQLAGSGTTLAHLPLGTANVLAKEVGLPHRWDHAIDAHATGQTVRMDLGAANGEAFLLMAGVGWDAAIASHVSPGLKKRTGHVAYVVEAAKWLPRLRSHDVRLTIDGRDATAQWGLIVIGNTRLYGGLVEFTPGATANDGLLDVCAVGPRRPGEGAMLAARLITHRLRESRCLHLDRGLEITVDTPGIPVQLDGDFAGETPMTFTVRPGALLLSVPSGPLPPVFQPAGGCTACGQDGPAACPGAPSP